MHKNPLYSPQPETFLAQQGINTDRQYGAVMPPLYLSSNFSFTGLGQPRQYDYTRTGNPTRDQLGDILALLEGGARGIVTSTGMSAITLVLSLLRPEELLLAPDDCYGGSHRLFQAKANQGHFKLLQKRFNESAEMIRVILEKRPKMVWIETPSNPLLRITDIAAIASAAEAIGAWVVVDNTFLTPVFQQPLHLGADIVLHSTTKYLNGHGDVVGGAVIAKDPELGEKLAWWANCLGLTGSPFDAYLTLRGVRTLSLRLQQHAANAQAVAEYLSQNPAVARVYYPGLKTHFGHALAARQQKGFGGIVSFELKNPQALESFVADLRLFTLAESLGGFESLICHPATMTHAAMVPEARKRAGIHDGLLRLSLGIEATDDLLADLEGALSKVGPLVASV